MIFVLRIATFFPLILAVATITSAATATDVDTAGVKKAFEDLIQAQLTKAFSSGIGAATTTTTSAAAAAAVDTVTLKKAAEDFLQTPFVKAVELLQKNVASPQPALSALLNTDLVIAISDLVPNSFPQVDKLLSTPDIIAFKALIEKDGASPANLRTFLQSPFVKAIDSVSSTIADPEDAVKTLIQTPFVKGIQDLKPLQVQANTKVVPVVKLLQTPLVKTIDAMKNSVGL